MHRRRARSEKMMLSGSGRAEFLVLGCLETEFKRGDNPVNVLWFSITFEQPLGKILLLEAQDNLSIMGRFTS